MAPKYKCYCPLCGEDGREVSAPTWYAHNPGLRLPDRDPADPEYVPAPRQQRRRRQISQSPTPPLAPEPQELQPVRQQAHQGPDGEPQRRDESAEPRVGDGNEQDAQDGIELVRLLQLNLCFGWLILFQD